MYRFAFRLELSLVLAVTSAVAFGQGGSIADVRLKGRLGETLDRMIERHVAGTDVDYITAPGFRNCWGQGIEN